MTAQALTLRDPRLVYRFDAVLSLTMGLGLIVLADPLAALVGWAPMHTILVGAAVFLFPWALFNWAIGAATGPDRLSLAVNMAGDMLWAIASVALLVLYSAQMTGIGVTLILGQALAVAAVGAVKFAGRKLVGA
ncbi:hypothetical protein [Devosia sp.]|uniref:hypothetical protein n=1 Tax=Devosia sp. TaxID=1871048 RepID=UPI001B0DDB2A|nr:hypothetical protein [Devosia sp.]MBO9589636.1 hypothetical protein [Devosia sp.]